MLQAHSGRKLVQRMAAPMAAAAALLIMGGCQKPQKPAQMAAPVQIGVVQIQTAPITEQYIGQTSAKETVDIKARVGGFLQQVYFQEGAHVRAGQKLFAIEPTAYQATLASAEAALARDQASLTKATQDVNRLKPLAAAKAAPQSDLDAAVAQQASYQAAIMGDKAQIAQAQLDLSYTTVRSPIDGVIGKLAVTRGNLVGKNENTLLATISSYSPIYVYFSIPEGSAVSFLKKHQGKGAAGQLTLVMSDGSEYPAKGSLDFADRAIDQNTGTLTVRGVFPNPQGLLRPGQFARVKVAGDKVENAVLIPQKAVTDLLAKKMVMVVDDNNIANLREVVLGGEYQDMFIIKSGLKGGEKIIVEGLQKARPGAPVTPLPAGK